MSSDAVDRSWRVRDERFFCDRSIEASFSWSDYVVIFGSMLVVALSGFILGLDAGGGAATSVAGDMDESEVYEIDGFEVVVLPRGHVEMRGRTGFVRWSEDSRMYVQGGRSAFDMMSTCNHEWKHLVLEDYGDAHDFIYEYQDVLPVDICFEFVRRHFGEEEVSVVRDELRERFKSKVNVESYSGYW